jgi:hypothetical protein
MWIVLISAMLDRTLDLEYVQCFTVQLQMNWTVQGGECPEPYIPHGIEGRLTYHIGVKDRQ